MSELEKFIAVMKLIHASPWYTGIFTADSQVGGFEDIANRIKGGMNEKPNGTPQEILDVAEVAVKASLGMS